MFSYIRALVLLYALFSPCSTSTLEEDESFLTAPKYTHYDDLAKLLHNFENTYPELAKVNSIGKSVEGRELFVLRITNGVSEDHPGRPAFKYVANMHGDESVGRQLVIYLAEYLLRNFGQNDRVTKLVNDTDIYLMPSLNPDGFEASKEGHCESPDDLTGRNNAQGIDLNRDFPDQFDKRKSTTDEYIYGQRQPETQAMIRWLLNKQFVLSGNLHGGAVVASYPYDDSATSRDCCKESPSPDDAIFKHLAHVYADRNSVMKRGDSCPPDKFVDGVTNGAYWYKVEGGMQDFNYVNSNSFEVTFELSCCKYPKAAELPKAWILNKDSLLAFIEQTQIGAAGFVTNENGVGIKGAKIQVEGVNHEVETDVHGDYWRLLLPGVYQLSATAPGYAQSEKKTVTIPANQSEPISANFTLKRHERSLVDADFVHHNYESMVAYLKDLSAKHPTVTRLYSIGKSVEDRDLYVLEVTKDPGRHIPGKPEFKYVANMHGNEVVGREMLLLLAKYLCEKYAAGDERVGRMLNTTRIHLMPTMNPDGYEKSTVEDYKSVKGRANAHNVDLNRNFPDQFGTTQDNEVREPETAAVMQWSQAVPFVLSANLHGGALVANYPYDGNGDGQSGAENPAPDNDLFVHLAHVYSNAHHKMHLGRPCKGFPSERFPEGITNGAKWYVLEGGMQDWSYLHTSDLELTLELGCFKFPPAADLPAYWQDNKDALLAYIEQVHHGIHGFVHSHIGHGLSGATLSVHGVAHAVHSARDGDYWRLLTPGTYNVTASKDGYESVTEEVTVPVNGSVSLNFTLMADDPQHWSSAYDFRVLDNVVKTRYHKPAEVYAQLAEIENRHPDIAEFKSGDSLDAAILHRLELTDNSGSPEETKFQMAIISNMYASQPLGQEMLINFARHLSTAYAIGEPVHRRLLKNAVISFIPNLDPLTQSILKTYDGTEKCSAESLRQEFGDSLYSYLTRIDLNPLSNYTRESAFINLLQNKKFDLVLELDSGSEDVVVPEMSRSVYESFAQVYQDGRTSSDRFDCSNPINVIHHKLIDLLAEKYGARLVAVGLSCCKLPAERDIAAVWRNNLRGIMKFMELANTGVVGFVKNEFGQPMRSALVTVAGVETPYRVTRNMAHFHLMLPPGTYKVTVQCHNYEDQVLRWRVEEGVLKHKDVTMRRVNADHLPGGTYEALPLDNNPDLVHITGLVLDRESNPLAQSNVSVRTLGPSVRPLCWNATDAAGRFAVSLPVTYAGRELALSADKHGFITQLRHVTVNSDESVTPNILFKLERDDEVLGMPRLVFVMVSGVVGVALVSLAAWCLSCRQKARESRKEYLFTQLPSDDKRPLCEPQYEILRKPYYDDDDLPPSETNSEDDIVLLRSDREWKQQLDD